MKSKKKLLTIAFLLVIIGVIFTVFYLKKTDDKKTLSKDKPVEERGQKEVEPSKKEEEREETDVKPKEENKKEVVKPTPNVKTQPKVVQKPKPTNKPQVKPQPKVQPTPKPTPQPKQEQKPWEKLGLTEDQYKNKPMYSWETVDFKTREECINYGNTHAPFSTGEGGYSCGEVNSYTRFLGWHWSPRYYKKDN